MVRNLKRENAMLENKVASFGRELSQSRVHFDESQLEASNEGPRGRAPIPTIQSRPRSPSLGRSRLGQFQLTDMYLESQMALKAQAKAIDKLLLEAKRKQKEEEDFQLFGNELIRASP